MIRGCSVHPSSGICNVIRHGRVIGGVGQQLLTILIVEQEANYRHYCDSVDLLF